MKLITYSRIGYNAPGGANWAYGIWKVDMIDTERQYVTSFTVKETFGGECGWRDSIKKELPETTLIESKGTYTKTGTTKITGVSILGDIESMEFINQCVKFLS
jgi:hypothetical protein